MGKAISALESQKELLKRLLVFLYRVRKRIEVVEAYIVGSRARGDYCEDSDLDVVLIVKGLEKLNFKERILLLSDFAEPGIDYRVYTVDEWVNEKPIWIRELKKEAIKIFP